MIRQPSTYEGNSRYEITVGPSGADIVGLTGRAIQIAIEALASRGGGIVRVLPGEYMLDDSIRLRPNVTLRGDMEKTILRRIPLVWSPLALDADVSQSQITPERLDGFRPGMGLLLWEKRFGWSEGRHPYVITHIENGTLFIDSYITGDRCAEYEGRVVNYFPMVLGVLADGASIDGFTVDAAVDDPDGALAGMRSAVVYLWRSRGVTLRNLITRNGRGDGICWGKSSIGTLCEDCQAYNNDNYGIHPGSHSMSCKIRRCDIHDNSSDGLYICWGISQSEFTDNKIYRNGIGQFRSGISIGHKDTDNLIARNHVYDNKKYGICFRRKTMGNAAHRVTVRDNIIENNGTRADEFAELKKILEPWESIGAGVHVCGMTQDLVLENNVIRETRQGAERLQQHALVLMPGVSGVRMKGNEISGHPGAAIVDDSGGTNELQEIEEAAARK